jgi:hypothetical protein
LRRLQLHNLSLHGPQNTQPSVLSLSLNSMPEKEYLITFGHTVNLVSQCVPRRNEAVATDTVFSVTPDDFTGGIKAAQILIWRKSLVADVCGMKTDKEFVNRLEENICEWGAMDKLNSDCAHGK